MPPPPLTATRRGFTECTNGLCRFVLARTYVPRDLNLYLDIAAIEDFISIQRFGIAIGQDSRADVRGAVKPKGAVKSSLSFQFGIVSILSGEDVYNSPDIKIPKYVVESNKTAVYQLTVSGRKAIEPYYTKDHRMRIRLSQRLEEKLNIRAVRLAKK